MSSPPAVASPATHDPRVRELLTWAQSGQDTASSETGAALAALAGSLPRRCAAAPLAMVAAAAYARVPGHGPRDLATGHAVVDLLARLGEPGARELVRLQQRVRYHHPRIRIDRALEAVQQDVQMAPDELEDAFGGPDLTWDLTLEIPVDRYAAVIAVSDDLLRVSTSWRNTAGETLRSRPRGVTDDPDALASVDIERRRLRVHLSDVRHRVEQTMLEEPTWTAEEWAGRMFADPLRAAMARRLVWRVCGDHGDLLALPRPGGLEDVGGRRVNLDARSLIALWHPAREPGAQLDWQRRLDALGIRQPVDQAWRDVVLPGSDAWAKLEDVHRADQVPLRGFLRNRGWDVPYVGLFDHTPFASRVLMTGGPIATLGLDPMAGDAWTLAVGPLTFHSRGVYVDPRELPAAIISEAARDVLGALAAGNARPPGSVTG